jgi:hypothetical protein
MQSRIVVRKQTLGILLALSLLLIAPFFKQQIITGVLVNALLFISLVFLGRKIAVSFALLPSLLSLVLSIVHPMMVPLIMISNLLLLLVFSWVYEREGFLAGVFFSGLIKAGFLFFSAQIFLQDALSENFLKIISPIQLVTAWGGGVIAYFAMPRKLS